MPVYASCDSLKSGTRAIDLFGRCIIIRVTKRKVGAKSLLDQRSTLPLPKKKKKKKKNRSFDLFNNCKLCGRV